jgi:hypothetical protein
MSKTFFMFHRHIFKINTNHVCVISHKLIHISVNLPNNPLKIKFSLLMPNLNIIMIINTLLLQPIQLISKFIGYSIHPMIHIA